MTDHGINIVDGSRLRSFIERVEKLSEEKKAISDDITDVYAEATGVGYDAKIIRKIVAARKKAKDARDEENALLALYSEAIGQADLFA